MERALGGTAGVEKCVCVCVCVCEGTLKKKLFSISIQCVTAEHMADRSRLLKVFKAESTYPFLLVCGDNDKNNNAE